MNPWMRERMISPPISVDALSWCCAFRERADTEVRPYELGDDGDLPSPPAPLPSEGEGGNGTDEGGCLDGRIGPLRNAPLSLGRAGCPLGRGRG
jgi:hypothetical protein